MAKAQKRSGGSFSRASRKGGDKSTPKRYREKGGFVRAITRGGKRS